MKHIRSISEFSHPFRLNQLTLKSGGLSWVLNKYFNLKGSSYVYQGCRSLRGREWAIGRPPHPNFLWILSILPSETRFARSTSRFRPPDFPSSGCYPISFSELPTPLFTVNGYSSPWRWPISIVVFPVFFFFRRSFSMQNFQQTSSVTTT